MTRDEPPARRYERALAAAGLASGGPAPAGFAPRGVPAAPPSRPPPGAATVRPPARRTAGVPPRLDDLLATTADGMLLVTEPDGTVAFDISVRDDVFDELACRIAIRDGRVTATFRVGDASLRRLLLAEAGRLRVMLSERGFSVGEVTVSEE